MRMYTSPIILLIAGGEEQAIYAHKEILERSKFFNACLHPQHFKEGVEQAVVLPEDHPDAITIAVEFLYRGHFSIPKKLGGRLYPECLYQSTVTMLIDLYLTADRLYIEKMANDIVTVLYKAGASFAVRSAHFKKFEGVDSRVLPLKDFLRAKGERHFADTLRRGRKEVAYGFEQKMRGMKPWAEEYDEECAWSRQGHIHYLGNACKWHKHTITAECQ